MDGEDDTDFMDNHNTEVAKPIELKDLDLNQIRMIAQEGHDDIFMSEFFGVSHTTWLRWRACNHEFRAALKAWEHHAVTNLARRLYQRGMGYSHHEVKVFSDKDLNIVTKEVIKHYPPDTKAAMAYLTNKDPDNWKNKQTVEATISTDMAARISQARKRTGIDTKTPKTPLEGDDMDFML